MTRGPLVAFKDVKEAKEASDWLKVTFVDLFRILGRDIDAGDTSFMSGRA